VVGKPVRPTQRVNPIAPTIKQPVLKPRTSEQDQMNEIVSGMTEELKRQQAAAFNFNKAENLKKMQEIT
jgi:hypothetical protein